MSDQEIIQGLHSDNQEVKNQAGKALLQLAFKDIYFIVRQNKEEAMDLFRETYLALYKQITKPDWRLQTTLSTYLSNIARYIYYKKEFEKKRFQLVSIEKSTIFPGITTEEYLTDPKEFTKVELDFLNRKKAWEQLDENCKKLLKEKHEYLLHPDLPKTSWKDIARKWNTTENFLKKKASECRKKLLRLFEEIKKS